VEEREFVWENFWGVKEAESNFKSEKRERDSLMLLS
jgi:hypothetical protein